jgi:FdhE protein
MTAASLQGLEERHPEWAPWLAVLREVEPELASARWDAAVPDATPARAERAPLLAGVRVRPDDRLVGALWNTLKRSAAGRTPSMRALNALPASDACAIAVFYAALEADEATLAKIASESGAEAEPVRAVAALLAMPFLHACRRRWTDTTPKNWRDGYCPTCGAWPAFAEVCGVERARYLRCGRCGSGWQTLVLSCPYCETTDHDALGALVPEESGADGAIEVCNRCGGYVKAFTRLRTGNTAAVMLEDLASAELDLAATARGYRRPSGAGYALHAGPTPPRAPCET